jgi:hypothetical protein
LDSSKKVDFDSLTQNTADKSDYKTPIERGRLFVTARMRHLSLILVTSTQATTYTVFILSDTNQAASKWSKNDNSCDLTEIKCIFFIKCN